MRIRRIILPLILLCCTIEASGQFYVGGNERASLRWMSVTGPDFKVIYPCGLDSLAMTYLKSLEEYRPVVASGVGMASGQFQKKPLQVLLHTQNPYSNGSVTWTPSRMELLTIPQWNNPSAMPWIESLAVHEGRHAAQMQNGYRRVFKPFGYILGQIIPAFAAAYPGKLLLEGDAVVAETALTASGRGRSSDFLGYYMYAINHGDTRNYIRWRVGSYYNYTPDHYAYGYLILSGIQYRYNCPDFMAQYMDYVSRRPYDPWPLRHNMRRVSGKLFKPALSEIMATHYGLWAADTVLRAPFTNGCRISPKQRHLTGYEGRHDKSVWIKKDIYHTPALVYIDSCAKEHRLLNVSAAAGMMQYCRLDSSLVWNEVHRHPRWSEAGRSVIRKYHIPTGKAETIAGHGDYYYPIEYGRDTLAAVKYLPDGSSRIVILDINGRELDAIRVPSGIQPVQIASVGRDIYSAAISDDGFGLWKAGRTCWDTVLAPLPVQIRSLSASGSSLTFESDRNGSNEYYRYDIDTQNLVQLSSSLYGGKDYHLCEDGSLAYSRVCEKGSCACVIPSDSVLNRPVRWEEFYRYPIADSLSRQALSLALTAVCGDGGACVAGDANSGVSGDGCTCGNSGDGNTCADVMGDVTEQAPTPERYRKFPNAFRFHSWAPVYIDIDALQNLSFENVRNMASLGAMAFFQNTLSTLYGYVGYKAAKRGYESGYPREDQGSKWAHSGHINLTYSGLYPIFEGKLHFNERRSCEYYRKSEDNDTLYVRGTGKSYVYASLRTYVPWQWNNGVLQWGVIPAASIMYGSDIYLGSPRLKFTADIRTYVMRQTPAAAVYPYLGIGAQLCWADPLTFAQIWGYLPGIAAGQGLKLSATGQWLSGDANSLLSTYAYILPRGFQDYSGYSRARIGYKLSADYAIPLYMGDWHILDMFYCTRGIVTPHIDVSLLSGGNLASAGCTFEMEFGSFFWIRTPVTAGVTYSYNFGSLFNTTEMPSRHYVGATFNISLPN